MGACNSCGDNENLEANYDIEGEPVKHHTPQDEEMHRAATKIQASFRGQKTRRELRERQNGADIARILEELGPYNYEERADDGVQREVRNHKFDNGDVYDGEWNVETNMRDGKGKQTS